jgi:hypothetical protein
MRESPAIALGFFVDAAVFDNGSSADPRTNRDTAYRSVGRNAER